MLHCFAPKVQKMKEKIVRAGWKLVACIGLIPLLFMAANPWFEVLPSAQWSARSTSEQIPLVSRYAQNSSREARVLVLTSAPW